MTNPNENLTRADLDQQLEIHSKAIELQILLSQQQEKILEKLERCEYSHEAQDAVLQRLDIRTWKQNWLFFAVIFSIIAQAATLLTTLAGRN